MMTQAVCPSCGAANRITGGDPAAANCGRCKVSLGLTNAIEVDDAALARHLERTVGLVLVDVWAPWCGPCRAMAPQFSAAARRLPGLARFLKLNIDHSETARHLGISGVPALLLFRNGRIIDRRMGLMRDDAIIEWIREQATAGESILSGKGDVA